LNQVFKYLRMRKGEKTYRCAEIDKRTGGFGKGGAGRGDVINEDDV